MEWYQQARRGAVDVDLHARSPSATRASSLTIPWLTFRNHTPPQPNLSGVTDCGAAQTSSDNTLDEIRNTDRSYKVFALKQLLDGFSGSDKRCSAHTGFADCTQNVESVTEQGRSFVESSRQASCACSHGGRVYEDYWRRVEGWGRESGLVLLQAWEGFNRVCAPLSSLV